MGESAITNTIIEVIRSGAAPHSVKIAAARGILPLTNEEMLEALVRLTSDVNDEVRAAARKTIDTLNPESFLTLAADTSALAEVLGFLCLWPRAPRELIEAVIFNGATPDAALTRLALESKDPHLIEVISLKQQSLIRSPELIEAILANPARTPEAERRAREVKSEFFEKQFGVRMVAEEQRARGEAEQAAREAEQARRSTITVDNLEDLVRLGLIEDDVDDEILIEYETNYGPFDASEPQQYDHMNDGYMNIDQVISEVESEGIEIAPDRLPVFQRIALMLIKDRVMLAIKGTREARMILVRDPNRIVAGAVLRNPRLTETEVEGIASIRSVPEDVLRQIGQNRGWTRSYIVIHNLVRNPRTPIAISLGFLNRIQTRDLRILSTNKNIPDVIRTTSARLFLKRSGG